MKVINVLKYANVCALASSLAINHSTINISFGSHFIIMALQLILTFFIYQMNQFIFHISFDNHDFILQTVVHNLLNADFCCFHGI